MQHHRELRNIAERYLAFATPGQGENEGYSRVKRPKLDYLSTRICEKRRRDKMNDRLADLRRLIPASYIKQGKSRIQKLEIIDMAIQHITDLTKNIGLGHTGLASSLPDRYLGFKECQDEVMRFLVEVENWDAHGKLCNRMMKHLEQAGEKFRIMNDECSNKDIRLSPQSQASSTRSQNNSDIDNTPFLSTSKRGFTLTTTRCYKTPCSEDSSQSTEPGSSTSSSTNKNMQHLDFSCIRYDEIKEPVPMENNPGKSSEVGSRSRDVNQSYKFKRIITKRFSEDITSRVNKSCDLSSRISKEFTWPSAKKRPRNEYTRSAGSTSSYNFPLPSSSNDSTCISQSSRCSYYQPGFVLHPTCSFYIPLSINASNVEFDKYEKEEEKQRMAFHSVRIPVIFDG